MGVRVRSGCGWAQVHALCFALGYEEGVILADETGNPCPEVHVTSSDGKNWTSNLVSSTGSGRAYKCSKLRPGFGWPTATAVEPKCGASLQFLHLPITYDPAFTEPTAKCAFFSGSGSTWSCIDLGCSREATLVGMDGVAEVRCSMPQQSGLLAASTEVRVTVRVTDASTTNKAANTCFSNLGAPPIQPVQAGFFATFYPMCPTVPANPSHGAFLRQPCRPNTV